MGRPRKYDSNAEKQAAYRKRLAGNLLEHVEARKETGVSHVRSPEQIKRSIDTAMKLACSAYAPHGTKCKFCGKDH